MGLKPLVLSVGLIISHYWGKIFLCTLHNATWILMFSNLVMETGVIHSPLWVQLDRTVSNPFRWFFPHPQVESSSLHVGWSIHQGISLCAALFSLVFCPVNFSSIISVDSQLCFLTVNSLLDSSWTPLPVLWPGNYLITIIWSNRKAHLIFYHLSAITVLCCLMSCLAICCFIYCVCFSLVPDGRINITFTLSFHLVRKWNSLPFFPIKDSL